jgi:hypothetical protein
VPGGVFREGNGGQGCVCHVGSLGGVKGRVNGRTGNMGLRTDASVARPIAAGPGDQAAARLLWPFC